MKRAGQGRALYSTWPATDSAIARSRSRMHHSNAIEPCGVSGFRARAFHPRDVRTTGHTRSCLGQCAGSWWIADRRSCICKTVQTDPMSSQVLVAAQVSGS